MSCITPPQIATLVSFMDPNDDGISQDEFNDAFRAGRRLRGAGEDEIKGKELLSTLITVLGDITPQQWFRDANTSEIPGEDVPGLDQEEFLTALKKLGFRKKQALQCMRYMDPDCDGDVDLEEFNRRLETRDDKPAMEEFQVKVGEAMETLGGHMDANFMRIGDLFKKVDKDGSGEIEAAELGAFFEKLAMPSPAAQARAKKRAARLAQPKPVPEEQDEAKLPSGDAIADLMEFLDPDENGVSREELIAGFRDGRRMRATAGDEKVGKRILKELVNMIEEKGSTVGDWFDDVNTSATLPKGEPVIDTRELKKGLKKIGLKLNAKNLNQFNKFVDPDCDGDISWGEFQLAFDKIDKPSEQDSFDLYCGGTICQLELHMKKNKIRMLDLFRQIDKDNSGMIDNGELRKGLATIVAANGPLVNPKKAKAKQEEDATERPPASPRAVIEKAKDMDAKINPPVAAE